MKNSTKSSTIKNQKNKNIYIYIFDGVPLKGCVESYAIFRFCARNKKQSIVGKSSD